MDYKVSANLQDLPCDCQLHQTKYENLEDYSAPQSSVKYLWVNESMNHESMSQWVNELVQLIKP